MKQFFRLFFVLTILISLSNCAPKQPIAEKIAPPETYFQISIGGTPVQLQLALTLDEQRTGLMNRDSMPVNHGMLFLFDEPGPRSFWMRNTRIPLDIGYFDASGRLQEIHPMYPYNENSVPSRSQQVLIAIETNQGWFTRNQIKPGAQIDLDSLIKAIRSRGMSPANFNLQAAQ
jgi:uncharacterized membrane protein (UPF0127 family)